MTLPIVFLTPFLLFLRESAVFLDMKGDKVKALQNIRAIAAFNGRKIDDVALISDKPIASDAESIYVVVKQANAFDLFSMRNLVFGVPVSKH
jgi:hypothetical protein